MLQKNQRLKKSNAFSATYRLRRSIADALLILYIGKKKTPEAQSPTRVGFVVSKKIHKRAVKRNRIKRLAREAYRLALKNNDIEPPNWISMIFVARSAALDTSFNQVYDSVVKLTKIMKEKFSNEKTGSTPNKNL